MNCLITFCSSRKRHGCRRAIELYDGPIFKILRRHKKNFDVFIISAKYGLISENDIICNYDLKMTEKIAENIRDSVTKKFDKIKDRYERIYINLGRTYMKALKINEMDSSRIVYIDGSIGQRMKQIKELLNENQTRF